MFYEGEAGLGLPGEPARSQAVPGAETPWLGQAPALPHSHTRRGLLVWKGHSCISTLLAWLPKVGGKGVVKAKKCNCSLKEE